MTGPPATVASYMMSSPVASTRKLDDEDDDDAIVAGGPFENAKRNSSWSASTMRKELGSPRMSSVTTTNIEFARDDSEQAHSQQAAAQNNATLVKGAAASDVRKVNKTDASTGSVKDSSVAFLKDLSAALASCGSGGFRGAVNSVNCGTTPARSRSSSTSSNVNMNCQQLQRRGSNGSQNQDSTSNGVGLSLKSQNEIENVVSSWVRLKDSIHKAVQGDIDAAKEAWKRSGGKNQHQSKLRNCDCDDITAVNSVTSYDSGSILTYENYSLLGYQQQAQTLQQEEEAMQLRRLTSWETVGTYETMDTYGTAGNFKPASGSGVVEDDDGIPIDVNLLQNRNKKLQQQKAKESTSTRRKRVVRFDYPPISSLRECPRTQPDQIEDLFFTEHELEQIEDDRYCTISADDVEIVAISTSTTAESENSDLADQNNSITGNTRYPSVQNSPSSCLSGQMPMSPTSACGPEDQSFRNYIATPSKRKDSKKNRRAFSFDDVVNGRKNNGASVPENSKKNASTSRRGRRDSSNSRGSPSSASVSSRRMIKSVQIYLRERSVG